VLLEKQRSKQEKKRNEFILKLKSPLMFTFYSFPFFFFFFSLFLSMDSNEILRTT